MTHTQSDETYQGWTNHATWCVHLHLTNTEHVQKTCEGLARRHKAQAPGLAVVEEPAGIAWTPEQTARYTLANDLKNWVEDELLEIWEHGDSWEALLRLDLVTAYLERVDWNAIAVAFLGNTVDTRKDGGT